MFCFFEEEFALFGSDYCQIYEFYHFSFFEKWIWLLNFDITVMVES